MLSDTLGIVDDERVDLAALFDRGPRALRGRSSLTVGCMRGSPMSSGPA